MGSKAKRRAQYWWIGVALWSATAYAQPSAELPTCTVPMWSACDLVFPLPAGEDAARAELRAEFRSPHRDSRTLRAFHEGQTLVLRFSPDEEGAWDYRVTSSSKQWDAKVGHLTATGSRAAGFVHTANIHHFQTANLQPHLWMGGEIVNFASIPRPDFDAALTKHSAAMFNHLRVTVDSNTDLGEAAERIRSINAKAIVADVVLESIPDDRAERQRYVTEMVARFSAFNITWAGTPPFESRKGLRAVAAEVGALIADLDGYKHPRTTMSEVTSAPLADDGRVADRAARDRSTAGWMNILSYGIADSNVGAVEHQFYKLPALNTGIKSRADLWNATMNGQYPAGDAQYSAGTKEFAVWFDFMSKTRYWELQPYFDVQGGRALALPEIEDELNADNTVEAVEYIVYVEKPGPVELTVGKHGYDVAWINPATGERIKAKDTRDQKGTKFSATPPDMTHDWILHVSREGRKDGMLKSYKFESRRVRLQDPETDAAKVPFDIAAPTGDISLRVLPPFSLKSTRANREPKNLLVEWTTDAVTSGEGYRVSGTGLEGTLQVPSPLADALAGRVPTVISVRVLILNSAGKAYAIDRAFRLVP